MAGDKDMALKVAKRHLRGDKSSRAKTAGEVRFIKDRGPEDTARQMVEDFEFEQSSYKSLSRILWGISCSLGHLISSYNKFTKLKAVDISPDGKLGGQGYVKPISEIRGDMTEAIETMSSVADTLDDELKADHWKDEKESLPEDEQEEVEEMMDDSEDILKDPEDFADSEYHEDVIQDIED